jgi:hypothetical protein
MRPAGGGADAGLEADRALDLEPGFDADRNLDREPGFGSDRAPDFERGLDVGLDRLFLGAVMTS